MRKHKSMQRKDGLVPIGEVFETLWEEKVLGATAARSTPTWRSGFWSICSPGSSRYADRASSLSGRTL